MSSRRGSLPTRTFECDADPVQSVFLSPDAQHSLSGMGYKTLKLWAVRGNPASESAWELAGILTSEAAAAAEKEFRRSLQEAELAGERGEFTRAAAIVRRARELLGWQRRPEAIEVWQSLYRSLPRPRLAGAWCRVLSASVREGF